MNDFLNLLETLANIVEYEESIKDTTDIIDEVLSYYQTKEKYSELYNKEYQKHKWYI